MTRDPLGGRVSLLLTASGLSNLADGLLMTTQAAGSVLGSLTAGWVAARVGETAVFLAGTVALSLLLLIPWLAPHIGAIAPAFVALSACLGLVNVTLVSMRQRLIPAHLLGASIPPTDSSAWELYPSARSWAALSEARSDARASFSAPSCSLWPESS
jgi:MFS family permease